MLYLLFKLGILCLIVNVAFLTATVLVARRFRIRILNICLGGGPVILHYGILQLKMFPFSAHVRMETGEDVILPSGRTAQEHRESRGLFTSLNEDMAAEADQKALEDREHRDFDGLALLPKLLITLCGPISVALLAAVCLGRDALTALELGFSQVWLGALSPWETAQSLLTDMMNHLRHDDLNTLIGLTAAKVCAINLTPYSGSSGFRSLLLLVGRGRPNRSWESRLFKWGIWPLMILLLGWALALGIFLKRLWLPGL